MNGYPGSADPLETVDELVGPSGPVTVVTQGAGPTVLIVHGGSGDLTAWAPVAARLADGFRVLRYTRPVYRLDPPPTGPRAVAAEVGDVLAVARAAAAPVLLVGHSSGAVVALQAALAEPAAFHALVLYEPPLEVTHSPAGADSMRRARAALDAGAPAEAMRIHLTELVGMPAGLVERILADPGARSFFTGVAGGQVADNEMLDALPAGMDRFAAVDQPTLLLCGEHSPAHLLDRSQALADALPRPPQQVLLAGQAHGAERDDPDAVSAAIRAFAAASG